MITVSRDSWPGEGEPSSASVRKIDVPNAGSGTERQLFEKEREPKALLLNSRSPHHERKLQHASLAPWSVN